MNVNEEMSPYEAVKDANLRIFFDALDAFGGTKIVVWDPVLIKRFNMVATSEQLKQHKVVSMLQLDGIPGIPEAEHNHVVYILSTAIAIVRKLIICLNYHHSQNDRRIHHAFFVPELSYMARNLITQKLRSKTMLKTLDPLPIRIYPLYNDFFTLLMDSLPLKVLINNDWTELHKCAAALRQIEKMSLHLPNLRSKGHWSAQIVDLMLKMRTQDVAVALDIPKVLHVSDIVLIDRWLDPLTPLVHQLTYAGLIDELFDLECTGNIKMSRLGAGEDSKSSDVQLHDELYMGIRDLHIKDVGKYIGDVVNTIKEEHQKLKASPPSDSLAESKVVIRRLLDMQGSERQAETHTRIAERLMSFIRDDFNYHNFPKLFLSILQNEYGDRVLTGIEDLILKQYNHILEARLIALHCLVCGGFRSSTFAGYERLLVQNYGVQIVELWIKLQLMGLVYEKNSQNKIKCSYIPIYDFQQVSKRFSIFIEEDSNKSESMAYPYSGYIPLLVRHIDTGVHKEWKEWTKVRGDEQSTRTATGRKAVTIIFIAGGITLAELACLRKIHGPSRYVVISSSLITGKKIIKAIDTFKCCQS